MFLQQSNSGLNFGSVQLASGNSNIQQLTPINMQGQVVSGSQIPSGMNTGHMTTNQHVIQQTLHSTSAQVMDQNVCLKLCAASAFKF